MHGKQKRLKMTTEELNKLRKFRAQLNKMGYELDLMLTPKAGANFTIKPQKTTNYSRVDMETAQYLLKLVQTNMSYVKTPTAARMADWADAIRKLREIDGYKPELITKVIEWTQNDNFWRTNIRSGVKLREKFETLLASIQREQQGRPLL